MSLSVIMIALASASSGAPGQVATPQTAQGNPLIDRNRLDRAVAPALPTPPIAQPPVTVADALPGTTIKGIRFIGARAPAGVAKAARAYLGRRASAAVLTDLATTLSRAYQGSAVALYTVAIPTQNFARGVVVVSLTEGRIARAQVRTDRPGNSFPLLRRRMAALTAETPLSRATFERQLSLMRAIPGLTVTPDFADPQADGALVLTVTPKQKRTRVSAGFSNRGVDLLGDGQFDIRGEAYGLGIDGDQLTLAASTAADFKRYRYVSGGYAAPIGADGLTASANVAYLETKPKGFPITGHATQAGVSIGYPLIRGFTRTADLSIGLDGINSDNTAFGNLIASERTRAMRAAASYGQSHAKRSLSVSASLSKGLDIAGARVTAPLAELGFLKATAAAAVAQAVGKRGAIRLSMSGQYSDDALPAAERFAIGGEAIGRGFDTSLLTGDRGAGALAEVAYRPLKPAAIAQSEVYAFIDGGVVGVLARGALAAQHYSLSSAGAGVRMRYRQKGELGLEAARVVDKPYPAYDEDWRVSVSWRVTI